MNEIFTQIDALRKAAAAHLPKGEARRLNNYADKMAVAIRRYERRRATNSITAPDPEDLSTSRQIADRYIAKQAIFNALTGGRHISLLHAREFKVSEMHTQIHCIRRDIEDKNLPYELHWKWIKVGLAGKRCKEYWLEEKTEESK